jgi:putative ATPase
MSDLWQAKREVAVRRAEPLAVRVRPRDLDEVIGQTHLLGPGKLLRRMIDADTITSLILHGPPGTGKTTLAGVIAGRTKRRFVRENAASVGVKRIREIIDEAERVLGDEGKRTILFLDEIHRFTKAQQDVLLGRCGAGADHADRGNDGEPVVQREQRVDLAVDAVPAGAAERG